MKVGAFAMITKPLQEAFEQATVDMPDKTPLICGYYGRACRRMGDPEGANRALCMGCPLAKFCEE